MTSCVSASTTTTTQTPLNFQTLTNHLSSILNDDPGFQECCNLGQEPQSNVSQKWLSARTFPQFFIIPVWPKLSVNTTDYSTVSLYHNRWAELTKKIQIAKGRVEGKGNDRCQGWIGRWRSYPGLVHHVLGYASQWQQCFFSGVIIWLLVADFWFDFLKLLFNIRSRVVVFISSIWFMSQKRE